mgnify:CR=1 FL=1
MSDRHSGGAAVGLWHWRCSGACCLALHPVGCRHHHHQHFACDLCWLRAVCPADGAFVLLQARENGSQGFSGGGYQIYRCDADQEKTAQHPGSEAPSDGLCNLGRNKKKTVLVVVSLALSVTLFNALCAFVGGFSMEKYVSFMTCADFIVSTPDYFRYNPADEFITPEQIEEIAANTKSSLSGTGYAVRKPVYLWMTEDALRQDYARYESAEQLDSHMSRMEHRGDMVMGDTRIEALDNSLFDKLQVFDGDISPMLEPNNNAIAIAVSLDDYGNLPNPEYYPKVGDTITATYADDVKYIDSRTGELRTEDTPEEYFQEKLYGARDVEYTVCAW